VKLQENPQDHSKENLGMSMGSKLVWGDVIQCYMSHLAKLSLKGNQSHRKTKKHMEKTTGAFSGAAYNFQKSIIPSEGKTNKSTSKFKINGNLRTLFSFMISSNTPLQRQKIGIGTGEKVCVCLLVCECACLDVGRWWGGVGRSFLSVS
jgi:hypothetical protein